MSIKQGVMGAVAGAALMVGALAAPAQAAPSADGKGGVAPAALSCSAPWADRNTIGYKCTGNGNVQFRALGLCGNGSISTGAWRYATNVWSYAYCAGKGGLVDGTIEFR